MTVPDKLHSILYKEYTALNTTSLNQVKEKLLHQLGDNLELTPSESFDWEDEFIEVGGTPKQLEEMKKSRPAFGDNFRLKGLIVNEQRSVIMAQVNRVTDNKDFTIDLHLMEAQNSNSNEFDMLKEYSIWYYSVED